MYYEPVRPFRSAAMSSDSSLSAAQLRDRSRDAGVLAVGRILSTITDAALPLVLVRLLGKAEVGVLGSVLLLYQTLALIVGTDLPTALMYHMPGKPIAERRALAWQQALGLLGFGVIAALLLAATSQIDRWALSEHWLSTESSALLRGGLGALSLLALMPIGDLPARILPNLLVIEGRADAAARFAIIKSFGNALFVLTPALLGLGVNAVLIASSLFGLAQGGALLYFMRILYRGVPSVRAPTSFMAMVRFALPLGVTDIVSQLGNRLDRYITSLAFSAAVFAEYYVGAFQIPVLTTIAYSVGTAYQPLFTELIREGRGAAALEVWRGSIKKVALIVVPCSLVFVVAAEEVVSLLFTSEYARAAGVFRWYALLTAGRVTAFGSMLVAAGRPRYVLYSAIVALALNASCSALGLRLFGFEGPAIGLVFAFFWMCLAYCYYIARALGLRLRDTFPLFDYLRVFACAGLAALPALLVKRAFHLPAPIFVTITALSLLGLFVLLGRGSGLIEREDLRYLTRRLGSKAS
jgi:O-antigen/teichoic acid export membrane protein